MRRKQNLAHPKLCALQLGIEHLQRVRVKRGGKGKRALGSAHMYFNGENKKKKKQEHRAHRMRMRWLVKSGPGKKKLKGRSRRKTSTEMVVSGPGVGPWHWRKGRSTYAPGRPSSFTRARAASHKDVVYVNLPERDGNAWTCPCVSELRRSRTERSRKSQIPTRCQAMLRSR